jgi:hypothetical protein
MWYRLDLVDQRGDVIGNASPLANTPYQSRRLSSNMFTNGLNSHLYYTFVVIIQVYLKVIAWTS